MSEQPPKPCNLKNVQRVKTVVQLSQSHIKHNKIFLEYFEKKRLPRLITVVMDHKNLTFTCSIIDNFNHYQSFSVYPTILKPPHFDQKSTDDRQNTTIFSG